MGVGMGMAGWEWVGMKAPHYPIYYSQVADHQTLLMDPSFCILVGHLLTMGMGIARLVYWEWEWEWEWLDGNGWEWERE